jgi:hypothetical protein
MSEGGKPRPATVAALAETILGENDGRLRVPRRGTDSRRPA